MLTERGGMMMTTIRLKINNKKKKPNSSTSKNMPGGNLEDKFARLEFVESNTYNRAYYRHTGQWWTVDENVTAEFCIKNIKDNPLFYS